MRLCVFVLLSSAALGLACESSAPGSATSTPDGGQPSPDAGGDAPTVAPDIPPAPAPDWPPTSEWTLPEGFEGSAATCANGDDDDDNGYADCDDRNCTDALYVWTCGSLENGPESCADGVDNPEAPLGGNAQPDGLVDCDDPDCAKNPYLPPGICDAPRPEGYGSGACEGGVDDDGDGFTDCEDFDCLLAPGSPCGKGGKKRILFDAAHGQSAGGADWHVDTAEPFPRPSNPSFEVEWAGKYSRMGLELLDSGDFVLAALPRSAGELTYGADGAFDLARYDVLVLPEASSHYAPSERAAIEAFVRAGGGLFLIGNHAGADRDNNGVDAVLAFNELLGSFGDGNVAQNPAGLYFQSVDYDQAQDLDAKSDGRADDVETASHPVMSGSAGPVAALTVKVGTTIATPSATALIRADVPGAGAYAAASSLDAGRIVAVGDSAFVSDETDSHGGRFGSTSLKEADNAAFVLNTLRWLAGLE